MKPVIDNVTIDAILNREEGSHIGVGSARLRLVQDGYDEQAPDEALVLKDYSLTTRVSIADPGWYDKAKADLAAQATTKLQLYTGTVSRVLADTGQPDLAAIAADIKQHIEGELA